MSKNIIFYTDFNQYSAEAFIENMNEYEEKEEITVRSNSGGGSVLAGWGMCAAVAEHKGKTTLKVDGMAASMMFFFAMFFDNVECLDVTSWMVHKASYPSWYSPNEEEKAQLEGMNAHLKAKMKARFDSNTFKDVTGVTIDAMFKDDGENVWITSKQAKKLGLVNKVNKLNPSEAKALASIAACTVNFDDITASFTDINNNKSSDKDLKNWPFAEMLNLIKL